MRLVHCGDLNQLRVVGITKCMITSESINAICLSQPQAKLGLQLVTYIRLLVWYNNCEQVGVKQVLPLGECL